MAKLNNKGINASNNTKVTKFKTFNFEKRSSTKYQCPLSHYSGYNLWLLKPTHLNRGRGIHVFRELDDLFKLMKEYSQGKDEEVKTAKKENGDSPQKNSNKANNNLNGVEESGEVELVNEEDV